MANRQQRRHGSNPAEELRRGLAKLEQLHEVGDVVTGLVEMLGKVAGIEPRVPVRSETFPWDTCPDCSRPSGVFHSSHCGALDQVIQSMTEEGR